MRYFNKIIVISAIVLFCAICLFSFNDIPYDDSFISYRVALNFKNGFGFNFNQGGESVEGFSNFLWVIVLAAISSTKKNIVNISIYTGLILSIFTLIGTYLKNKSKSFVTNAALMLVIVLTDFFAVNTINGLETALFTLMVFLAISTLTIQTNADPVTIGKKNLFISALFCFLTAITRPEGGLFFALIGAFLLLARKNSLKEIICFFVIPFTMLYTPYFFGRYFYFGFFLPNTYYARQLILFPTYKHQLLSGFSYIYLFFCDQPHLLFLLISSFIFAIKIKTAIYRLYLLAALSYIAFIFSAGGDWNHMFGTWRFMMPVLILLAMLFKLQIESLKHAALKSIYVITVIILTQISFDMSKKAPSFVAFEMARRPKTLKLIHQAFFENNFIKAKWFNLNNNHGHFHLDAKAALYLKENYPDTNMLLSQQAGRLAFFSDFTFIDTAGLVSEKIAHMSHADYLGKPYMDFLASLDADCFVFPVIEFKSPALYSKFLTENGYELNHVFCYSEMKEAFDTIFPKLKKYPAYVPPGDFAPYFLYSFRKKRDTVRKETETIPVRFEDTWFELPKENLIISSEHY